VLVAGELATQASPVEGGINAVRGTMDALKAIRTFIKNEFIKDIDFGVIPGTGGKPTLYQPGAQKTAMYFNAAPDHQVERHELGNGHVEFVATTRFIHRGTGAMIGSGVGSCSSMEKKYRYRGSSRKCPKCGAEAIIKGRQEYGGGWICYDKKGGCKAKFKDNDPAIVGQAAGDVENPDIWDTRNTVLKMAVKRSFVSAALSLGCLAELFTQDIGDTYDVEDEPEPAPRPREPHPNNSGHKTGKYASPEQVAAYLKSVDEFCTDRNAEWLDSWVGRDGSLPADIKDLLHPIQMTHHFIKWIALESLLPDVPLTVNPETGKLTEKLSSEQEKGLVAIVFARDPEAVAQEAWSYYEREAAKKKADILRTREVEDINSTEGGRRG
jgi:hypothetical protein